MWYSIYKNSKEVTTMRKELLKGLSEEQIKKVEACKSSEEILALAKEEGVQLSDEQLEAVSGGTCQTPNDNPLDERNDIFDKNKDITHKSPVKKPDIVATKGAMHP